MHLDGGRIFGDGVVNAIRGSWRPGIQGRWELALADGQRIQADSPGHTGCTAFVMGNDLRLATPGAESGQPPANRLAGTISRLIFERVTGRIVVTVWVGSLVFNLKISQDETRALALFPGQPVTVSFGWDAVRWM